LALQHQGHLIKEFGDGFLAVFGDVGNALRFARALPMAFCQDKTVSDEGLSLKLAIHFGQVSVGRTPYGEDVFGRNVNLVARLEGVAARDEIVISDAAMQQLPEDELGLVVRREISDLRGIGEVAFGRLQLAAA
jgi:adenylate cyclase